MILAKSLILFILKMNFFFTEQPNLSLDAYMSKNTSEDNASFAEILEETQQKHREKHAWLYENESSRKQVRCHIIHLYINYALDLNTSSFDKLSFLCI